MASSLLALFDDIITILDDLAVLSKVAAQKTAGVLGDDLALNAQQVSEVSSKRELPVVWAVTKGSLVNKAILVPLFLTISILMPWAINIILLIGGSYLCFEGIEKVWHYFKKDPSDDRHQQDLHLALSRPDVDLLEVEKDKIKGAIRTDFVLSAEIIAIILGTVTHQSWMMQALVLSSVALLMTFLVYGAVAMIVRLDDWGYFLMRQQMNVLKFMGSTLINAAPVLMKILTIAGTVAMFLVGGSIFTHAVPQLHFIDEMSFPLDSAGQTLIGAIVGGFCFVSLKTVARAYKKIKQN